MGSKIWSYKLTDRNATTFFGLSPEDLPKFFPVHFKDVCHCWGGCYLDFWRVPQRGGVNWGVLPSGGDSQCPSFPHPSFEILLQWGSPPYPKGLPRHAPRPRPVANPRAAGGALDLHRRTAFVIRPSCPQPGRPAEGSLMISICPFSFSTSFGIHLAWLLQPPPLSKHRACLIPSHHL